jgi:ADP-ribose pyrophosphatase YjhB (NUDIX family)
MTPTDDPAPQNAPFDARCLVSDTEGRWLLVKPRDDDWRFPGGRSLSSHGPADICRRALWEQLDLNLTSNDLMITTWTVPTDVDEEGCLNFLFDYGVYRAGELSITIKQDEIIKASWIDHRTAMALLHPSDHCRISLARGGQRYGEYFVDGVPDLESHEKPLSTQPAGFVIALRPQGPPTAC